MYRNNKRTSSEQQVQTKSKWRKINPETLSPDARKALDAFYALLKEAGEAKKHFASLVVPAITAKVQGATEENVVLAFRYGLAFQVLSPADVAAGKKREENLFDL